MRGRSNSSPARRPPVTPGSTDTWRRYRRYLRSTPDQVFEWHDGATGARGWLVINSLRGGAAGGGTRMCPGLDREEVVYLAKTMELKFAFSGPPVGGAKAGIDFDPEDPRRREVLRRWFEAVEPFLATRYGTAGDLNVDGERDVGPLCSALGLRHPQQGVIQGHLGPSSRELDRICRDVREGTHAPVDPGDGSLGVVGREFLVADLVTGYGVARAGVHLHDLRGESLEGKRVVVEGFGNVGGAACLYLARAGARVVAVVDRDHALVAPEGLGAREIAELLARREDKALPTHPLRREGEGREAAYEVPADVFVPAAVSGSVGPERLDRLSEAGVRTLLCAANQPFREERLGATAVQREADRRFEVVVDAVGGLGMARAFYCLMTGKARTDGPDAPEDVFREVDAAARRAVEALVDRAGPGRSGLLAAGLGLALDRVSD